MPRRIELELTSERPDGTWTWRAAGAREPRGELEGSLLPGGSKVGDVVRADADFNVDGITVLSVLPPKGVRVEPERLEILPSEREFTPVTSTLVGKGERGGDRGGPRRDRGDRPERTDRGPRPRRDDRPGGAGGPSGPRTPRPDGPRAERPRRERPAPPPPKPKPKKLRAGRVHRDALVTGLSPEQQPIAEQLFRGGMPSVRTALEEQNAKAKAEGLPEMPSATVLSLAEELVGRVRVADWLDRAEAAAADAEEIALRDLRAVVTSADDVARDESTRELATRLREVLDRRTGAEQTEWLQDLTTSLEGGRVVRALRLSSRPPQPGETLPPELTTRLAEAAGAAMTAEIAPDRWGTLLDAVAYSPVRRNVVPDGAPAEPGDELLAMARKHAGRVPSAAKLFGIEPPPPPASKRGPRAPKAKPAPQKVSHPPLPPLPGGARRIPPPPRPTAPTASPDDTPAVEAPAVDALTEAPIIEAAIVETAAPVEMRSDEPAGDVLPADAPITHTPEPAPAAEPPATPAAVEVAPAAVEMRSDEPAGDVLPADAPITHAAPEAAPAAVEVAPEAPVVEAPAPEAEVAPEPIVAAAAPEAEPAPTADEPTAPEAAPASDEA